MNAVYQVIRYDPKALVCHSQVKHLGYFDTKEEAVAFSEGVLALDCEIIVRPSKYKY